jgi:hypothetical protein
MLYVDCLVSSPETSRNSHFALEYILALGDILTLGDILALEYILALGDILTL